MEAHDNILAIVQARVGSTRLPGKVLADIAGEPMLTRVVSRVAAAQKIDAIVVATSNTVADDRIVERCCANCVAVYRGSENDVLDR
ncbi:MAG: cytidylyltransferase domain-containing protein, partial [Candidatus Binatia bacterium]